MNFVTLLLAGFWLHPCSGCTLPSYHRSIQSRGLHLPAPRAPEATWDDWTQDLSRSLADKKWGSLQFSGYQQKILYKNQRLDTTTYPEPSKQLLRRYWDPQNIYLKYQTSRGMTGCLGYIQFLWDTPQKETNIFQISSSLISFKWSTPRSIGKVECRRKSEGSKAKDPCKSHRIHVWHIYLHFR